MQLRMHLLIMAFYVMWAERQATVPFTIAHITALIVHPACVAHLDVEDHFNHSQHSLNQSLP